MRVTQSVDVQDCEQCPFHTTSYYSENVTKRSVHCKKLKKHIHYCIGWLEEAFIPNDCPFKDKEFRDI